MAEPASKPSETLKPAPTDAKEITLDTKDAISDLKKQLNLKDDEKTKKELEEALNQIKEDEKSKVKKISIENRDALKKDIEDGSGKLEGTLKVKDDGELSYEKKLEGPETSTPSTDTPAISEINLKAIEGIKIPEAAQEAMAKFPPKTRGFFLSIVDKILDSLAGFGILGDWVAQLRGFNNASLEKKADAGYTALVGDEGKLLLDKSPLSNILILEHIEKNEFKKILGQYPTLDFSNKTNIEAAFLGKHADKPELAKYHRIYEGMREMCGELSSTESVAYNPEERLKRLLSYSRKEEMDEMVDANQSDVLPVVAPIVSAAPVENGSATPEVQNQDRKEAEEAEVELKKAKSMTAVSDSEKALQAEAIKKATENINAIKDREKGIILSALKETDDKLADSTRKKETLEAGDAVKNKSEIAKLVKEVDLYTKSQKDIKAKIDTVMVTTDASRDKWTFQDTANTDTIILARIGLQGILGGTLDVSSKRETGEVDKTDTETIAEEVEELSKKIEKSAVEYKASTTSDRKTMLKNEAQETLDIIKKKEKEAIDKNKEIQAKRGKDTDDTALEAEASKSEAAMKQIMISLENAQKAIKKIETEGASELEPLDPMDKNNLVYQDGKLYQTSSSNNQKGGYRYHEMFFDGDNLRQGTYGKTIEYKTNKELQELGYKTISYGEANNTIINLPRGQLNKNADDWIYISPEHFSGKLRNIKIN